MSGPGNFPTTAIPTTSSPRPPAASGPAAAELDWKSFYADPQLQRVLELALANNLETVAFPAISTGVYAFPADRAARIAMHEANSYTCNFCDKLSYLSKKDYIGSFHHYR